MVTLYSYFSPSGLWKKFGELGLLGITADPEFGGSGMSYFSHALVSEEIGRYTIG